jgi:hypothetical protein
MRKFLHDERALMIDHFGEKDDKQFLIALFFERLGLSLQDNQTTAT